MNLENLEILTVFLVSGRTFTFRNVALVYDNEYAIAFDYRAMSDGFFKRATFYKTQLAGVSQTAEVTE